jgi:hypothetical protein
VVIKIKARASAADGAGSAGAKACAPALAAEGLGAVKGVMTDGEKIAPQRQTEEQPCVEDGSHALGAGMHASTDEVPYPPGTADEATETNELEAMGEVAPTPAPEADDDGARHPAPNGQPPPESLHERLEARRSADDGIDLLDARTTVAPASVAFGAAPASRRSTRPKSIRLWVSLTVLLIVAGLAGGIWALRKPPAHPAAASVSSASSAGSGELQPTVHPTGRTLNGRVDVLDTATLLFGEAAIRLNGIAGQKGLPATQMSSFIREQGGVVGCEALSNGAYRCRTRSGYDVGAAALVNGAARATDDAPAEYRDMEAAARAQHRGMWQ